jgi:hypothetical protein
MRPTVLPPFVLPQRRTLCSAKTPPKVDTDLPPQHDQPCYAAPFAKSLRNVKMLSITSCLGGLTGAPLMAVFGNQDVPLGGTRESDCTATTHPHVPSSSPVLLLLLLLASGAAWLPTTTFSVLVCDALLLLTPMPSFSSSSAAAAAAAALNV